MGARQALGGGCHAAGPGEWALGDHWTVHGQGLIVSWDGVRCHLSAVRAGAVLIPPKKEREREEAKSEKRVKRGGRVRTDEMEEERRNSRRFCR